MPVSTLLPMQVGDGTGDVIGPASAVNAHLVSFSGTTGKIIQDSGIAQASVTTAFSNITSLTSRVTALEDVFEVVTPTDGDSIVVGNPTTVYVVAPASGLLTLTITMPASPANKQRVTITGAVSAVTALTLSANTGQSLIGPITALAVGAFAQYIYRTANTTWYRVG